MKPTAILLLYCPDQPGIISEITSHTFADCDRMFLPEFMYLAKYASERFAARYGRREDVGQELADII